ncbi:hypothetical protein [Halomonas sp. AOP35-4E-18]|uniref:hypothetical protein n=1 Tax=Halomonas sp. AOP35-4E-18 TaxID=3457686 RepID=UPI00403492BF
MTRATFPLSQEGTYLSHSTGMNMPITPPQNAKQGRPVRPCNANMLRQLIRDHYQLVMDMNGVYYLMPFALGGSLLMEPELIGSELKRWAADFLNRDVSNTQISNALDILRSEPAERRHVAHGRTWLGEQGERYIDLDGHYSVWERGQESRFYTSTLQPHWRPANCCPYSTGGVQGAHAFDVRNIQYIEKHLPLPVNREWLIYAYMVLALMPERQMLALEITGVSHQGKTRWLAALKQWLDPCIRDDVNHQPPSKVSDLDALAWHHHVLVLNGVEKPLSTAVQRRLLGFLNGTTLAWKKKGSSSHLRTKRMPLISADEPVVTDPALVERTLSIELPLRSPPASKSASSDIDPNIGRLLTHNDLSMVQAALFGLLGQAHAHIDTTFLDRHVPDGWQDFCKVGMIVSRAVAGTDEAFWAQYEDYRNERARELIEQDPVAMAVERFFDESGQREVVEYPAGEWLTLLSPYREQDVAKRDWPANARAMGAALKRAAPLLNAQGYRCLDNGKRGSTYRWEIAPISIARRHV